MRIIEDNVWLCSDCMQVACNGPHGIELVDARATTDGLKRLGAHLVPDFDPDTQVGERIFSARPCASCQTTLAGYRARFARLG